MGWWLGGARLLGDLGLAALFVLGFNVKLRGSDYLVAIIRRGQR